MFSHLSSQLGELLLPKSSHPKLSGAAIMQRHQEQMRAQQPPGYVRDLQRQQRREASREHAAAAAAALRHADATDSEAFSSGNQTEIEEEEEEEQKAEVPQIRSQTPPRVALAWTPDSPSASAQQLSQSSSSLPQAPCEFASFGCESLVHADRGMHDPHYTSAAAHHISLLQLKFALIASQHNLLQQDFAAQNDDLTTAQEHSMALQARLRVEANKLEQARSKIKRQNAVLQEVQAMRLQNVQDLVSSYAGQPPLDAKSLLRSQRKQLEALKAQLAAKDTLLLDLAGLLRNTRLGPHILSQKHAAENPRARSPKAASAPAAGKKKQQKQQPQKQKPLSEQPLVVLPSSNSPTMLASLITAAARRPPPPALTLPAPVPAPKMKPQQTVSALAQRKLLEQSKPSSLLMRSLVASLTGDPSTQAAEAAGYVHNSRGKENDTNAPSPPPPPQQQQQKQSQQPQQQERESATAAPKVFGPVAPTPQQQQQQVTAVPRSSRRKLRQSMLKPTAAAVEDDCPIPLMTEEELIALLPKDGSRVPRPIFMPDPDRPIVDNSHLPWEDYDGQQDTERARRDRIDESTDSHSLMSLVRSALLFCVVSGVQVRTFILTVSCARWWSRHSISSTAPRTRGCIWDRRRRRRTTRKTRRKRKWPRHSHSHDSIDQRLLKTTTTTMMTAALPLLPLCLVPFAIFPLVLRAVWARTSCVPWWPRRRFKRALRDSSDRRPKRMMEEARAKID